MNWAIFLIALGGFLMMLRDGPAEGLRSFGKVILGIAGTIGLFTGIFGNDWTLVVLLCVGAGVFYGGRYLNDIGAFRPRPAPVPGPPRDTRWDAIHAMADDDDPWAKYHGVDDTAGPPTPTWEYVNESNPGAGRVWHFVRRSADGRAECIDCGKTLRYNSPRDKRGPDDRWCSAT